MPFGCYRREIFDRVGLFDEELIRNQDDEFNFRLIRRGGRVLLLPDVLCRYFASRSLRQLAAHVLPVWLLQAAGRAKGGPGHDGPPADTGAAGGGLLGPAAL